MSGSPALEAQLRDGSTLAIEIAEPPIDRSRDWNRLCWWPLIREEMMEGKLSRWLHAPHFIGHIGGEIAGTMCYYAPEDTRDVGALQFVSTEERFRRRGVGSALVGALIRHFTAQGGRALYLCTSNPVAGHLYESHGFRYHVGDGMRFLAPGAADFDRRWFAAGATTIATRIGATWPGCASCTTTPIRLGCSRIRCRSRSGTRGTRVTSFG